MQLIQKQNNLSTSLISVVEELNNTSLWTWKKSCRCICSKWYPQKRARVLEKYETCVWLFLVNRADKVKEVNEEQLGHRDFR